MSKKIEPKIDVEEEINFDLIEKQLLMIKFDAKKYFPLIQEPVQFRQYGFNNKKHRKILFIKTKQLIQKYPKQKKKKTNVKTQTTTKC